MKDYQEKSKQMRASTAVKARGLNALVGKVVVAAIAMALLTGCAADNKNQPAEMSGVQIQEESQWVSKYGIPEEMRIVESLVDQEGTDAMADILSMVTHDFGEPVGTYVFDGGIRVELYADGYGKVYLLPELTQTLSTEGDRQYSLNFSATDGSHVCWVDYLDTMLWTCSDSQGGTGHVMSCMDGTAVYYLSNLSMNPREPVCVEITERSSNGDGAVVATLTRKATGEPVVEVTEETEATTETTEEVTEATTETTEPAGPAMTTKVLDLGGCSLQDVSAVLGDYHESNGFYWFDGGYVGYVYAYGTDRGNNYIQAPLDRLITNCPATLSVAQLQEYFPGGYTFYDEMDGRNCFAWDYRGCTVVIFENDDGTYTPDSLFYYNCDVLAQQSPQAPKVDASVNADVFQILGKTDSQIAGILGGESGGYDYEFGCWVYTYQDSYVAVYMDSDGSGTCIGFNTPLKNVVNMSDSVSGGELKKLFGDTYQDPWNGNTAYQTMYKGGQLRIFQDYGDEPDNFGSDSVVNFRLAGKELFPGNSEQNWNNSSYLFYGGVTVYRQTATELECAIEYYQLTPPNRIAESGRITLTSTDGITYTASGVMDTWESTMNVTVTMLEEAAQVTFDYTKMGDLANFCFDNFIVYK